MGSPGHRERELVEALPELEAVTESCQVRELRRRLARLSEKEDLA